jgi:hypothetical protein
VSTKDLDNANHGQKLLREGMSKMDSIRVILLIFPLSGQEMEALDTFPFIG